MSPTKPAQTNDKLPHPNFSDAYVFPDGELVPINVTLRAAEESRFEVRYVESLRKALRPDAAPLGAASGSASRRRV